MVNRDLATICQGIFLSNPESNPERLTISAGYVQNGRMPPAKKTIRAKIRPSGLYAIQYAEEPGHWHATGQDNEHDALSWARRKRGEILAPKAILFRDASLGFFAAGSPWTIRQAQLGRSYSAEYLPQMRGRLDGYLVPAWGSTPISKITRRMVQDWLIELKGQRGQVIKNSTKNKIIDCLIILYREWADSGLLSASPMEGLGHFSASDETTRDIFTAAELELLFPDDRERLVDIWADQGKQYRQYGQMWLSYFIALRDTGCRPGELLALTWGDWRKDDNGFAIRKAVENTTGIIKPQTKTGSRKPAFLSERGTQELLLWCANSQHALPGDLIWSLDGLYPMRTESANKHFTGACLRAGVERGNRTPYCIRHTFATRAFETLSLHDVQILLGHSAKSTTALTSYFHPTDDMIMRMGQGAKKALEDSRD